MAGTRVLFPLVRSQDVYTSGDARDVPVGAVVKAVYVELWTNTSSAQVGSQQALVAKFPANSGITFANHGDLNSYENKKNIFYTTQGLSGDSNSNPTPIIRQWIKIPKGKQRIGLGDKIQLSVASFLEDLSLCGLIIYKVQT